MISTNALPLFLPKHYQNGVCEHNIRSIKELIHSDEPDVSKLKRVCADFPDIMLLTKSATHRKSKVIYAHTSIGNKSIGETVTTFALVVFLKAPNLVMIDVESDGAGNKIHLPTTEVLLRAAIGNISKSKSIRNWAALNAVLHPPLLAKTVIF